MYYGDKKLRREVQRSICIFSAVLALIVLLSVFTLFKLLEVEKRNYAHTKIEVCCFDLLSVFDTLDSYGKKEMDDVVAFNLLCGLQVQHPHFVLAQMKLESGNYQSALTKTNNNYFGMRHPSQRMTVSLGSKNGYAKYRNWAFSVLDYALWQKRYAWNLSEQEYLQKLGSVYAEDAEYISKIQNISKGLQML